MKEKSEKKRFKTITHYKDCLGMESGLRILCDESYIQYLCKRDKDPRNMFDLHVDICQQFEVKDCSLGTTSCVYWNMRTKSQRTGSDGDRDAAAYALSIPFKHCGHGEPVASWLCLRSVMDEAVKEPYFLGSLNKQLCSQIFETGLPCLSVGRGGDIIFFHLNGAQKIKLEAWKLMRHRELEKEQQRKLEKEMVAEKKMRKDVKKRDKAMQEATAVEGELGGSRRSRGKKKRNRRKKNKLAAFWKGDSD